MTSFGFWRIRHHVEFGTLDVFSKSTLDEMVNTGKWRWKRLTVRTFAQSPPSHAFWLISPFFSKRFSNQLGLHPLRRPGQTTVMCCWPPISPGACYVTIKSEVKLEKTLTFVLIAAKTNCLFPQLKTGIKILQTVWNYVIESLSAFSYILCPLFWREEFQLF